MQEQKTIRAFIAIELPAKIIDGLKKIQNELKDGTNKAACPHTKDFGVGAWVKPENVHLTIKFLGDIEADKVDSIARLLEDAAAQSRSFDISVKGVGGFPTIDNPRVLWVGVEDDKNLSHLYDNLENGLTALGFKKEDRPFKPHLTLGSSLCLFQSRLTPEGAVHTKLKEYRLQTEDQLKDFI
ncbi:MAG: RNA 2',3'-cyclic phosphodiesterase [Deltaproteobacteria bacterium]|nr:RNA 2',3'-cyclic phosphodiesterase [Deltaproteobacteria bacterium]